MASEREEALRAVVEPATPGPPNLEEVISEGVSEAEQTKRLELMQKHALARIHAELGWFGRVFGAEDHAPLVIAFFVVASGLVGAAALWWVAFHSGVREFWSGEAHIALGAVTTALGYVFGRGTKDSSR